MDFTIITQQQIRMYQIIQRQTGLMEQSQVEDLLIFMMPKTFLYD